MKEKSLDFPTVVVENNCENNSKKITKDQRISFLERETNDLRKLFADISNVLMVERELNQKNIVKIQEMEETIFRLTSSLSSPPDASQSNKNIVNNNNNIEIVYDRNDNNDLNRDNEKGPNRFGSQGKRGIDKKTLKRKQISDDSDEEEEDQIKIRKNKVQKL